MGFAHLQHLQLESAYRREKLLAEAERERLVKAFRFESVDSLPEILPAIRLLLIEAFARG